MKEGYLKTTRAKLEEMSTYLGSKPWFVGNEVIHSCDLDTSSVHRSHILTFICTNCLISIENFILNYLMVLTILR